MIKLACQTITWGRDLSGALRDIKALGFHGFESFAPEMYGGKEIYLALVEAAGLPVASIYSGGSFIDPRHEEEEVATLEKVAELLVSLGSREMVFGGGHKRPEGNSRADYEQMARRLNRIGEIARSKGLRACFHPHSGTCVETGPQVDLLMELTDPQLVFLCPDVAHLAKGGADPAAYIEKYCSRICYVHIKDLGEDGRFVELGQGSIDLKSVLRRLEKCEYRGWLTVELDRSERTPKESAEMSLQFLRDQGIAA